VQGDDLGGGRGHVGGDKRDAVTLVTIWSSAQTRYVDGASAARSGRAPLDAHPANRTKTANERGTELRDLIGASFGRQLRDAA
jgi:hypothetical protein